MWSACSEQLVGDIERPLLVLLAAVGFVLLIACANLANLMLGRTAARRKELAIRTALGAGRGRLIRQIVTEAFVLALRRRRGGRRCWRIGPRASSSRSAATAFRGRTPSRSMARVLAFALVLATIAALLSGLFPALQASRKKIVEHLREGGAGRFGRREPSHPQRAGRRGGRLSLILLTGAGLLIRTLWTMQQAPSAGSTPRTWR